MALKQTSCVCSRYLSPTRFHGSPRHRRHIQIFERQSRTRSTDFFNRWQSKSVIASTKLRYASDSSQEGNSVLPPSQTKQIECNELETVDGLAQNIKNWTAPKVDITAFAKLIASLNIEIPKYLPNYQQLIPNAFKIKVSKPLKVEPQETAIEIDEVAYDEKIVKVKVPEGETILNREHYFEEAMKYTRESVQNYYSDKYVPSAQDKSVVKTVSPSAAEGVNEKKTENILFRQISTIRQMIPSARPKDEVAVTTTETKNVVQKKASAAETKKVIKKGLVNRVTVDRRTRALVITLKKASSSSSRLMRLEDMCRHLATYSDAKNVATKVRLSCQYLKYR